MNRFLKFLSVLIACSALSVWAQADYPDKAFKMIVPFPPDGVSDILARTVALKLSAVLGQTVVDNRAGANGAIMDMPDVKEKFALYRDRWPATPSNWALTSKQSGWDGTKWRNRQALYRSEM